MNQEDLIYFYHNLSQSYEQSYQDCSPITYQSITLMKIYGLFGVDDLVHVLVCIVHNQDYHISDISKHPDPTCIFNKQLNYRHLCRRPDKPYKASSVRATSKDYCIFLEGPSIWCNLCHWLSPLFFLYRWHISAIMLGSLLPVMLIIGRHREGVLQVLDFGTF